MCQAKEWIKMNEGLVLKLFKCTAGKFSIGYSRNIEDNGISKDEAELMLKNDLETARTTLYNIFGFEFFLLLPDNCKTVLIDMMYTLGAAKFRTFTRLIQAVKNKDFYEAATEIFDSKYARKDVPERAKRNAKLMES